MSTIPTCRRALAVGAVLALALTPAPAPAAPAPPEKEAVVSPVEKLRKELDRPITLKIDKQPLSTAVDLLHKQTGIAIVLDSLTIQQQLGFTPDQPPVPVDVDLKEVKTRAALRAVLAPYGLSFAPIGDTVIITTDDMAMLRQLRQRVSVDFDKVDFAAALQQLARETAVNLVLDRRAVDGAGAGLDISGLIHSLTRDGGARPAAPAKVSLQLEDVPLETAIRLLAEMANLKPVRVGNVLFVTSKENAAEMRNDPDLAQPNQAGRAMQDLQQVQLGGAPGAGAAVGGVAAPPGVEPVVPPGVTPDPAADPTKDQTEQAPVPDKPLTK